MGTRELHCNQHINSQTCKHKKEGKKQRLYKITAYFESPSCLSILLILSQLSLKHFGLNCTTLSMSTACTVNMLVLIALFSGTEVEYGAAMNCGLTSLLSKTVMLTAAVSVKAGEPSKIIMFNE